MSWCVWLLSGLAVLAFEAALYPSPVIYGSGVSSLLLGLVVLTVPLLSTSVQLLIFSCLALLLILLLRSRGA